MLNSYKILGVDADAAPAQIRRAYIDLMKRCHPDAPGAGQPEEDQAREVNRAFWTLRDPIRRAAHDRLLFGRNDARVAAQRVASMGMPQAPRKPLRQYEHRPAGRRLGLAIGAAAFLALGTFAYTEPQRFEALFRETHRSAITPANAAPAARDGRTDAKLEPWQIHGAVADMRQMLLESGLGAVESYSRRCFGELAAQPTDSLLDHCLAFDTAAALVEEPIAQRTGRHSSFFERAARMQRQEAAALLVTGEQASAEARRSEVERETVSAMANYDELPVGDGGAVE